MFLQLQRFELFIFYNSQKRGWGQGFSCQLPFAHVHSNTNCKFSIKDSACVEKFECKGTCEVRSVFRYVLIVHLLVLDNEVKISSNSKTDEKLLELLGWPSEFLLWAITQRKIQGLLRGERSGLRPEIPNFARFCEREISERYSQKETTEHKVKQIDHKTNLPTKVSLTCRRILRATLWLSRNCQA